jgi:hypothetical protein
MMNFSIKIAMSGIEGISFFEDRTEFPVGKQLEYSLENPSGNLDFETLIKQVGFYQR